MPDGLQLVADVRATRYLDSLAAVEDWVRHAVSEVGMTRLGFQSWRLPSTYDSGPGVSLTWEMVESHGAIETWPEHGVVCLCFYSCRPWDVRAVWESFVAYFGVTETLVYQVIHRFSPLAERSDAETMDAIYEAAKAGDGTETVGYPLGWSLDGLTDRVRDRLLAQAAASVSDSHVEGED